MNKGTLEVITGPMFSGKTSYLIQEAERAKKASKVIHAFHPEIDSRYNKDHITSHDGNFFESKPLSLDNPHILVTESHVVFIDEVQFFEMKIVEGIDLLLKQNINVHAAGLDLDYLQVPFPVTSELLKMADNVVKLFAKCSVCGKKAGFSKRLVSSEERIVIGGSEMYEARCATCYSLS